MIWVSLESAAEALEPGLRLPRIRFLPSPDATANELASRPMITADAMTSGLLERSLRNMGWGASLSVSCRLQQRGDPAKVAVGGPPNAQPFSAKIGQGPGTPRS